jgi:thiosulfate/3-mercaptopyruvate sulfurtransferase
MGIPFAVHAHRAKLRFVAFQTLIDAASLRKLIGDAGVAVIDCRFDLQDPEAGRRAYLRGHIPGARYADLNKDLSAPVSSSSGRHPLPTPQDFAAKLDQLGVGNHTQVVAYDENNGSFAARLWWMLRWVGLPSAAVLDGGLKAWIDAEGALASGEETAVPAANRRRFRPRVDAAAVVDSAQVASLLRDPRRLLVDARAAERYAGVIEPIDAVAGHIAGAVNHPFTSNLGPEGRFLPAAELRRRWEKLLAGTQPRAVAAMCGSGVTACHNLLSLEVAGLRGAKLYAGSWSEWIRDSSRPVARGA